MPFEWRARLITAAASSLLASALIFSAVEFTYRFFSTEQKLTATRPDIELGWSPIPNYKLEQPNEIKVHINSLGFRGPEPSPGKKSVLLIGDSITWGYGVSDNETISYFVNSKISSLGFQSINLGEAGYGTDQEYLRLIKELPRIPFPKKAVLIICENDLLDISTNVLYRNRKPYFELNQEAKLVPRFISPFDLRFLVGRSVFLKRILMRSDSFDSALSKISGDFQKLPQSSAPLFIDLLRQIETGLKNRSIDLFVALAPTRECFTKKTSALLQIETALNQAKIPYIDLLESLKEQNPDLLYVDGVHFTGRGAELVADILFQKLFLSKEN